MITQTFMGRLGIVRLRDIDCMRMANESKTDKPSPFELCAKHQLTCAWRSRVCFRRTNAGVEDVEIVDYH
jgi:hypothetical protein